MATPDEEQTNQVSYRWMQERVRFLHKKYARLNGYFWLPCPVCGKEFGGHEWKEGVHHSIQKPNAPSGHRIGICPDCGETQAQGIDLASYLRDVEP